jgi:phage-related protein
MKPVEFLGDALDRLRSFPESSRRAAGLQIDKVQRGMEPDDWKPLNTVGPGVEEIRIRDEGGAFRVVYLARMPEAVYVLHAFRKSTARTSRSDLALARSRFSVLMQSRRGRR